MTRMLRNKRDAMPQDRQAQQLRDQLLKTIAAKWVSPVFQPITDLQRGEISGFESLSRPGFESGFADVIELFRAGESTGLLWELEQVAREASLQAARGWPAGVQLFLNTAPAVFADGRFAGEILKCVQSIAGLTPDRVVLEITEESGEQHVEGLETQVAILKEHGFQIAIDDVGAGASGLNRIMALRPQWLKLNRALIQNIDKDRARQNLVRFLQHYTRLTGVKLIAEGIEREEELSVLIDIGVSFGQGFYLGKPGSREQTLDTEIATKIRERWSIADLARFADPRQKSVRRYARNAVKVDSQTRVQDIAKDLSSDRSIPGVVTMNGSRVVGWCARDAIMRASLDRRAMHPVAFIVSGDSIVIPASTTVSEAMGIAAARPESSASQPLVICDSDNVVGVLTVRDLLQAAAEVCHDTSSRMTSLTGLPGRARCDEHLRDAILRNQGAQAGSIEDTDAAVVDIQGLSDYNGAYGYEMGDRLLTRVVGMLRAIVQKGDSQIFLGHLGDDRFVICGPHAKLQRRLMRLLRQFSPTASKSGELQGENEIDESLPSADIHSLLQPTDRIGLRAVLVVDAFTRSGSVRDLHTLVDHLRRGEISGRLKWNKVGESIMYVDRGDEGRSNLRIVA